MGRVLVNARVENFGDLLVARRGLIPDANVRFVEITEALVDTGATSLGLPANLIASLGLDYVRTRRAVSSAGDIEVRMFGPAKLTIQGRDCPVDVMELPDGCPALIGQIPLEAMDFVVDPGRGRLIGNPAHGGEHVLDLY